MQYSIKGSDGEEYGPVDFPTLKKWVAESRVNSETIVTDNLGGVSMPARQISGLFSDTKSQGSADPPVQPPNEARDDFSHQNQAYYDKWAMLKITLWCALSLILFFVLKGTGLFVAAFTVYDAYRMKASKHPQANYGIAMVGVTLLILVFGWISRMQG